MFNLAPPICKLYGFKIARTLKNNLSGPFSNTVPQLFSVILQWYLKFYILSPMACALAMMINFQIESDISQLSQIIVRPSEFESSFKCQKKNTKLCHVSHVTCHVSHVTCRVSRVKYHRSNVTCHLSPVTNARSDSHRHSPC